jgi:hypothetical protein
MPALPLPDIQGFILRTYAMPALRVFVLRVARRDAAGHVLRSLSDAASPLSLTSAATWQEKPQFCLNLALTHAGLRSLGVPNASLNSFPPEFIEGAVARAAQIGDSGSSAPAHWTGGLARDEVHALVFLFAQSDASVEDATGRLRGLLTLGGGFAEISVQDGRALPGNVAHFGYRDGFAQPTIAGGLPPLLADVLPPAPAGEFLLGYPVSTPTSRTPFPRLPIGSVSTAASSPIGYWPRTAPASKRFSPSPHATLGSTPSSSPRNSAAGGATAFR